ncbi:hypothetical protein [Brevibacillus panacihumi]|uniref:hypothetical protein n=1 Tax=Brevibacillus panacihumi TaxID=497735 RepID=UPI003D254C77
MRYRPMDGSGDYTMGKPFLVDAAAVGQAIKTKLLLLKEEWWEQKEDGLPLFQNILGTTNTGDLQAIDLLIQERILATPNVNQILNFESNYNNRTYSFQCKVETSFGVTIPITHAF